MLVLLKKIVSEVSERVRVRKRFVSIAPFRFSFDVLVALAKNICELLVFILPIRVVLFLAAPNLPNSFDRFFPGVSRNEWIGIFTALVVLVHLAVLFFEWYLDRSADIYTGKFSSEHRKGKFSDADFLKSVYRGVVESRVGTLLLILLGAVVCIIYPPFMIFFVSVVAFVGVSAIGICSFFKSAERGFIDKPKRILDRITGLIFIALFCYIVIDFVTAETPPPVHHAFVAILIARRLLGAAQQKILDTVRFSKKRASIQRLFYRGHTEASSNIEVSKAFVDNISKSDLKSFSLEAFELLGISPNGFNACNWIETAFPWLSILQCSWEGGEQEGNRYCVLKVYEPGKFKKALHDLELYPALEESRVIPEYIGAVEVRGYQVHAFYLSKDWKLCRGKLDINQLQKSLFDVHLDDELVDEYFSVHPSLIDRFSFSLIERLRLVADPEEELLLEELSSIWPNIFQSLQSLPPSLIIPDGAQRQLSVIDQEELFLLGFGEWTIEPLGFNLNVKDLSNDFLTSIASGGDEAISADDVAAIKYRISICSYMALLERCCRQGNLREGIKVVDKILVMRREMSAIDTGDTESRVQLALT